MSILRLARSAVGLVALIMAATLLVATPAQAYEPGSATAKKVRYNAYTGTWDYSCSYSGWRYGAKVIYHCKLYEYRYERGQGWVLVPLASHKGTRTPSPSSWSTRTFREYPTVSHASYCVRATALSVDGGDSHTVCH